MLNADSGLDGSTPADRPEYPTPIGDRPDDPVWTDRGDPRRFHNQSALARDVAERAILPADGHGNLLSGLRTRERDGSRFDRQ